jgi:hypothetical protein
VKVRRYSTVPRATLILVPLLQYDSQPSEAKVANEEGSGKAAPTKFTAAVRDMAAGQRSTD